MEANVWVLTEVAVSDCGSEISSWTGVYSNRGKAVQVMQETIKEKMDHNEENGYPEIDIDWQDETGAQLSTENDECWVFEICERPIA